MGQFKFTPKSTSLLTHERSACTQCSFAVDSLGAPKGKPSKAYVISEANRHVRDTGHLVRVHLMTDLNIEPVGRED